METQEAIELLECNRIRTCHDCIHAPELRWCRDDCKPLKALDMAIDALKKQIPVKPVKSKDPRYGMGYEYYDWECPTCGGFLAPEPARSGDHHCKCGQAIDWEVDKK